MQADIDDRYKSINKLLDSLYMNKDKDLALINAIELANEILLILGANVNKLLYGEDALDMAFSNSKFKNQKMETWFVKHKYLKGARTALTLFRDNYEVYESNFFWLNESATKARISATVMMSPNWEDSELTMLPNYKVGIDFFLNNECDSLLIAISDKGNLRVLELNEKLSNTQVDILNSIKGCFLFDGINHETGNKIEFEPQRTIHRKLWNALELKEVNKKFYIGIADHFEQLCQHLERNKSILLTEGINKKNLQNFSNRLIGRILFIWFLRKKNIIDDSQNYFTIDDLDSTQYYNKKLKSLFFETLNTPIEVRNSSDKKTPYLNGGLFEIHNDDLVDVKFEFPKGWFDSLYKHLNSFNFTTDESTPEYQQVAIDPEMLGRVFENLLASIRPETSKAANERKNKGAYYTPREIVNYMCKETIKQYIKNNLENEKDFYGVDRLFDLSDSDFLESKSTGQSELWGIRTSIVSEKIIQILDNIKILDPACGSGAFPMGIMQLLVKTFERLQAIFDLKLHKHRIIRSNERPNIYNTKLSIINNSLYGSDIEPLAVEISRLRCWLSLIIDENSQNIEPLPNLDFNFVCANSLAPIIKENRLDFYGSNEAFHKKFLQLRNEYFVAHDISIKNKLRKQFQDLFDTNSSIEFLYSDTKQLMSWNPFDLSKASLFFDPEIMFNLNSFDLVISNPPYVDYRDIDKKTKSSLEKYYKISDFSKMINLYTYFYEMGLKLLTRNGVLCYISPQQYLIYSNTKGLRDLIRKYNLVSLSNFANANVFDADTYPFITIITSNKNIKDFKYAEFNDVTELKKPIFSLILGNPMDEPLCISKYLDLVKKISSQSRKKLNDIVSNIFVASSSTQTKHQIPNSESYQYIESSDIHEFFIEDTSNYIDKSNYSLNSLNYQINNDVIYTSRLTNTIRAALSKENAFLGGKINAIIAGKNKYFITGLLNSKIINFWYREYYKLQHMSGGALPINAEDLKTIPLPKLTEDKKEYLKSISEIVKRIQIKLSEDHSSDYIEDKKELDELFYILYSLNQEEKEIIESYKF